MRGGCVLIDGMNAQVLEDNHLARLDLLLAQADVCRSVGAELHRLDFNEKVGISQSALDGELPLNGLRHLEENGTTGWYIWGSEHFSEADDFFIPLCAVHLKTRCPMALKFLSLPPGWRFLTDGEYEDVWFDPNLI